MAELTFPETSNDLLLAAVTMVIVGIWDCIYRSKLILLIVGMDQ
jgi:hypothetical protein